MNGPVVVWGAGAIGGAVGAHWVRAGHEVVFVDLVEEHVSRIASGRLTIEGPVSQFTVGAPAYLPKDLAGTFDLIVLAVKAQHTQGAMERIRHHLSNQGAVISCQNGMNELAIADVVGRARTVGAFVNFGADWLGPGQINYGGRGSVVVGELDGAMTPRIADIHRLFRDFDDDAVLTDNIFGFLWSKLAYLAVLSAGALTNETTTDFLSDHTFRPLIVQLVREILAVAVHERARPMAFQGFDPDAFLLGDPVAIEACIQDILARRQGTTKHRSGIWRDLAVRKRPTEVPSQFLPVRAAARSHGLPTMMIDHLMRLIEAIEVGDRANSLELALELAETARAIEARQSAA